MYCHQCGLKLKKSVNFCKNCGGKAKPDKGSAYSVDNNVFYSTDWRHFNVITVASLPYFDVMIDKENLYLIKLPSGGMGTLGLVFGLLIFSIIGAFVGAAIGNSSDRKNRQFYRLEWFGSDNKLISNLYKKNIYICMPLNTIKDALIVKKDRIFITYNNKKIKLKKNKKEGSRFNKYLKKYVL